MLQGIFPIQGFEPFSSVADEGSSSKYQNAESSWVMVKIILAVLPNPRVALRNNLLGIANGLVPLDSLFINDSNECRRSSLRVANNLNHRQRPHTRTGRCSNIRD